MDRSFENGRHALGWRARGVLSVLKARGMNGHQMPALLSHIDQEINQQNVGNVTNITNVTKKHPMGVPLARIVKVTRRKTR